MCLEVKWRTRRSTLWSNPNRRVFLSLLIRVSAHFPLAIGFSIGFSSFSRINLISLNLVLSSISYDDIGERIETILFGEIILGWIAWHLGRLSLQLGIILWNFWAYGHAFLFVTWCHETPLKYNFTLWVLWHNSHAVFIILLVLWSLDITLGYLLSCHNVVSLYSARRSFFLFGGFNWYLTHPKTLLVSKISKFLSLCLLCNMHNTHSIDTGTAHSIIYIW